MFDIGVSELLVISVVALLVLGPEKLPGAARTFGSFMRKARQGWNGVRAEFERQMAVEDVKRSVREVREAVESDPGVAPKSAAPAGVPAPGAAPVPQHAPHD
jgi:sec-independent protein translocase protein TatB